MSKTKIEWTQHSWNPITGCSKVSPGCKNCYAERMAQRLAGRAGYPEAPNHFNVTLRPERLDIPLRRKKPTTYFVPSMGDLFHEDVPWSIIEKIFMTMTKARQHIFQTLTKRPAKMQDFVSKCFPGLAQCSPHIWLGTSIESPEYSYRSHYLRETPAAIRFISFESLLASFADCPGVLDDMDWIIVGGESGPGARPMHPNWVQGIRDQCVSADKDFFFKQWGAWAPGTNDRSGKLRNHGYFCADGKWINASHQKSTAVFMSRVGKKRAGRLLDGQEWNQMPTGAEPPRNGPRQ